MKSEYRQQIAREFETCVSRTIARQEESDTYRPFHAALLSADAIFWSRFERSFSTSFGQRVIQRISKVAAVSGGASEAQILRETMVELTDAHMKAIDDHIGHLRSGNLGRVPNWKYDLKEIMNKAGTAGRPQRVRVISDLWFRREGKNHYISIKTVMPNIDQTAEAKRDLLKIKLGEPDSEVFFALYYNPFGEKRTDYSWAPPKGIFDFHIDPVVLIGRDYWDLLGGEGTYETVLEIAKDVGERTRARLHEMKPGKRP